MSNEKPDLIVDGTGTGGLTAFRCSACRQEFRLANDKSPEVAVTELWAAFTTHIEHSHPDTGCDP